MNIRILVILAVSVLLLTGCGAGGADAGTPPAGDGGGNSNPFSGRLIAEGTGEMHTMDLDSNGSWTRRLSIPTSYAVPALHLPANELFVASLNALQPLILEVHDLATFGLKRSIEWPDTLELMRVSGLAVAPDGVHVAAVMSGLGNPFLEILNLETRTIVYTGALGVWSSDLAWTADLELIFALDLGSQSGVEFAGGIVAVKLGDFLAAEGDELTMNLITGFGTAEWTGGGAYDFALSPDGAQLAFARAGDIWVKDLRSMTAPHQLTVGPGANVGPVFSPDGSLIAFVEAQRYSLRDTYVIPNHRSDPVFIDSGNPEAQGFLLEARTLVDEMLGWLP